MKKIMRKILCIVLTLVLIFSLNAPAFAAGEIGTSNHLITNLEINEYTKADGTFVSDATYLEGGVPARLLSEIKVDGTYTILAEYGDERTTYEGVTTLRVPTIGMEANSFDSRSVAATRAALAVSYTYWGVQNYSVPVAVLNACSTVTGMAATCADYAGFGIAAFFLNFASWLFESIADIYAEYNCSTVYFKAFKYYAIDDSASRPIYYHKIVSYAYSDSARTNILGSGTDYYESLNFYF